MEEIRTGLYEVNLGDDHINFSIHGKLVFCGEDNKIYRIGTRDEGFSRLAARKATSHWGVDSEIFCKEEIIEETPYYIMTVQEKLELLDFRKLPDSNITPLDFLGRGKEIPRKVTARIFSDYPDLDYDKAKQFFDDLRIGWFGSRNVGVNKEGKIQIFDFIGNYSYNPNTDILIYFNQEGQHELHLGGL